MTISTAESRIYSHAPIPTGTPTATSTNTPTATSTSTTTPTPTSTSTQESTNTPTVTPTDTPIPTPTSTSEPTGTPTPTSTSTPTPSGPSCDDDEIPATFLISSRGGAKSTTIRAPAGQRFRGGSIAALYAAGDFSSVSEYFSVYMDGSYVGRYDPDHDDCTWRQAGSDIDISSYISGKSSFDLEVDTTSSVNYRYCGSYVAKIKACLSLSTSASTSTNTPTVTPTDTPIPTRTLTQKVGLSDIVRN